MDTLEAIKTRRSVREFTAERLTDSELDTLLECAALAPSARNRQPVRVLAVTDKEALDYINYEYHKTIPEGILAYTKADKNPFYHNAPALFVLYSDGSHPMDAGLMAENITLAAKAMGLASCILGCLCDFVNSGEGRAVREYLGIDGYTFEISVAVGHGAESPELKPRNTENFKVFKK